MKIYVVLCAYNVSQVVPDCAFKSQEEAEKYVETLNRDKEEGIARCRELVALQDGEAMAAFTDEKTVRFAVVATELK